MSTERSKSSLSPTERQEQNYQQQQQQQQHNDRLSQLDASAPGSPGYWRRAFSYLTGMGMTDEDRRNFEHERDTRYADGQRKRCEGFRDFLLQYSPVVRFMSENIEKVNGNLTAQNIHCFPCDAQQSGGFSPQHGILLCQNKLRNRGHAEDTMAHEMMHVYDHLRFEVDWQDLRHVACSEIRASSLSGECRWTREFFTRGVYNFTKQHQQCVRRRALLSVQAHPKCKEKETAERILDSVFESCFSDTRPFDEIYR